MGGAGSKEMSFSDFGSTEKNNSKSNKSKSQKNTQDSKSKSKSQSNKQENTESKKNSSKNKNNTQSSQQKEITEKTEKEEDEQSEEQNEETSQKKSSEKKSSEKKKTSNKEENEDEEESEEKTEKKSSEKKSNKKTDTKKENKVISESNEEDKNGEMFREGDEFTQEDAEISDINSYIENNKKRKLKSQKLNVPRQELNGEKYLEGDIEYKKIKNLKSIKEEKDEEEKSQQSGEQLDEVEQLKKKKMLKEYDFYLTKEINKNKFVKKNKDSDLPMDYSTKEPNKNQVRTYLCFVEAKTKKKKKIEIKPDKTNQLIRDEIYLFNQRRKQIKSIKPLKQEEYLKPYSYKVEFEMGEKGISNKIENKVINHDNYEYIDVYPNGEGYKFKPNDSDEEEKKEKPIKVENTENKEILNSAQIEEIKKKDENDIVNIINKGLEENKLVEKKPVGESANDF